VGKDAGVRPQQVAAHRKHDVLALCHDGHETVFGILGLGEDRGGRSPALLNPPGLAAQGRSRSIRQGTAQTSTAG